MDASRAGATVSWLVISPRKPPWAGPSGCCVTATESLSTRRNAVFQLMFPPLNCAGGARLGNRVRRTPARACSRSTHASSGAPRRGRSPNLFSHLQRILELERSCQCTGQRLEFVQHPTMRATLRFDGHVVYELVRGKRLPARTFKCAPRAHVTEVDEPASPRGTPVNCKSGSHILRAELKTATLRRLTFDPVFPIR